MSAVVPSTYDHTAAVAVAPGPVKSGSLTWATIGGLVWSKVYVETEDHSFATIEDGNQTNFVSSDAGFRMWPASAGTGLKDALVNLDATSSSAPAATELGIVNASGGYIDHDASGTVDLVNRSDTCGSFELQDRTVNACNELRRRLWNGALITVVAPLPTTGGTLTESLNSMTISSLNSLTIAELNETPIEGELISENWYVLQDYSAKHLRGELAGTLLATDTTGTINTVDKIDGHFPIASPTAELTFENYFDQAGDEGDKAIVLWDDSSNAWLLLPLGKTTEAGDTLYRQYDSYMFLDNDVGLGNDELLVRSGRSLQKTVEFDSGNGVAEGELGVKQVTGGGDAYFECTIAGDYLTVWEIRYWADNQTFNSLSENIGYTDTADGHQHSFNFYLPRILIAKCDISGDSPVGADGMITDLPLLRNGGDKNWGPYTVSRVITLELGDQFRYRVGLEGGQFGENAVLRVETAIYFAQLKVN